MAKRKVNPADLAALVQQSADQIVTGGAPSTYDPNFPVFRTPVNLPIFVYIPKTNVVSDPSGERMEVLRSNLHATKQGKRFGSMRCIKNLTGNEVFDKLGYDGECPACDATSKAWDLFNIKLRAEAKKMNVDPDNDTGDLLKDVRSRLLREEMDMKGAEEFVTFPIVIIPVSARFTPSPDAEEKMEVVFVHWRKKRFDEKLVQGLNTLISPPAHLGGTIWVWDFQYDTKGKQADAMHSAQNATYTPYANSSLKDALQPADFERLMHILEVAEQKASEFTIIKAQEVVVAVEFLFKEDMEAEVTKIMANTEKLLDQANLSGGVLEGGAQPQIGNPLASFGQAAPQGGQPQGLPQGQTAPSFGQAQPEQQAVPIGGQQPNFGQPQQGQPAFGQAPTNFQ